MSSAPTFNIDPEAFWLDPYPDLARMRAQAPIAYLPQLGATVFTRRDMISECEKDIETFSSHQPGGLMNVLMGHNMMRKDGDAHQTERRATFPALSPRTVRDVWKEKFVENTAATLSAIRPAGKADLVRDIALVISGDALRVITGLENMTPADVDRVSQAMIDGIANYTGDPEIEARCLQATSDIDAAIDARIPALTEAPDKSLLSVQMQADLPMDSTRANVKLAISGGQNEPRDAIAGTIWALLTHPEQLALIQDGKATWKDAFEEYVRWISPIGMSPRRIAQPATIDGVSFEPEERIFFMFSSANRDEDHFERSDAFDITRDNSKHIAFGAGPHFCAGAAASRTLIAEVALPMIFDALPGLRISSPPKFGGWAFRGPLDLNVTWDV